MQTAETSASAQRPALDGTRNPLIRDAETNLILPLGTSLRSMLAMLDDLKALLGEENVHIDSGEGVAAEGLFQDEQTGCVLLVCFFSSPSLTSPP